MQPHEGRGRRQGPEDEKRARQRALTKWLVVVIVVLVGVIGLVLMKRMP
jgi:hypothetical protein